METRYHGYPQPDLDISEFMRKLSYSELVLSHMPNTFEPLFIDITTRKHYAVPEEVHGYISLICDRNIKHRSIRAERMRNERL